jgi:3-dehydro-4-phosphotetronate decarboxylase
MVNAQIIDDLKQKLIELGKYIMEEKMTWGTAGNISLRVDEEHILVTASGTELGNLNMEDLTLCNINGQVVQGRKPSKELPMHLGVYKNRPEINAIIHAAPFYSTMAACSKLEVKSNLFVESMYYLERVERVPYFHPGTKELAEGVERVSRNTNVILLENHGVLVYDSSIKECRIALEILENTCKMLVLSNSSGIALQTLDQKTVNSFLNESGYKPRRVWDNE